MNNYWMANYLNQVLLVGACILLHFPLILSAQGTQVQNPGVRVSGSVDLTNNGVAPVPAFTLGDPALINSISISKGKFTYTPEVALDFDGNPWFIENWMRYQLVDDKFGFYIGADWSFFFQDYIPAQKEDSAVLETQRYLALEVAGTYKFSSNISSTFKYWYNKGVGERTIDGHFIDFTLNISQIPVSDHISLEIQPEIFFLEFTGQQDGLFFANGIKISHKEFPVSFTSQMIRHLWSNIPNLKTEWSVGVQYTY